VPPVRPLAEIFFYSKRLLYYIYISNGILNFNFLALVVSEILRGPKFTLVGPTPPGRPLAEIFFATEAGTSHYLIVYLISTF